MASVSRRRAWIYLCAALSLISAGGCAGTAPLPQKALDLNEAGADALAEGDLETAAARLSVALEYSPKFVDALVNLGLVECQRGNFARARQLLERAKRLNPDVAQPHHALGILAERERRPDRASENYLAALHVDPGFAPSRANLGRLQYDAGQLDAASLTFKKLVEIAPDEAVGYIGLAETLLRLGRLDEAAPLASLAAQRFADHASVKLLNARIDLHEGRVEAARSVFSELAERRDDFGASALAWLATTELVAGRPRPALGTAERALALDPDQPVALLAMSQALAALDDPRAAFFRERAERVAAGARSR
jgi:tetratricopeptide (TPR) repeat protein